MKIQVFDPPMCCSTGVCGPSVDPKLVRFAADLDWLERQGVAVERNNLSQRPAAFVSNKVVRATLREEGNDCLPLTLADGEVVAKGKYPTRKALAKLAGVKFVAADKEEKNAACCGGTKVTKGVGRLKAGKSCC